jgi:uncharacterized protein (DUF2252 family)
MIRHDDHTMVEPTIAQVIEATGGTTRNDEALTLCARQSGLVEQVAASSLFVLIGGEPRTQWLPGAIQLRDGYIVTALPVPDAPGPSPAALAGLPPRSRSCQVGVGLYGQGRRRFPGRRGGGTASRHGHGHDRGVGDTMSKISPGVLSPPREILTPDEWRARGRARRERVPLAEHAHWDPPSDRPDPVSVLEQQARTRVPDLVPIRYGRMLTSAFAYYRGAAAPMAWDLGHMPTPDLRVQCCGDAHLLNFGMFAAPERRLVFDVNDFDETLPAPFEWDVKRLAASFAVVARDNGLSEGAGRSAARRCARSYRTEMARYASMRFLSVWYSRIDIDQVTRLYDAVQPKNAVRRRRKDIKKAQRRTSLKAMLKFCDQVDGEYRIRPDHPMIVRFPIERNPEMLDELRSAVALYQETLQADRREVLRRYYFGDFARKVVGVGSVGTEAFVLLLLGDRDDEPLFLQLKEAQESVLAPFAGPSEYEHQGERVARGQRMIQAATDEFLGWTKGIAPKGAESKDYYVRQLRDMKGSMDVPSMDRDHLAYYAELCGWALARGHARTGRATLISGYLGSSSDFDKAIAEFSVAYAEQNERDHQALVDAVATGRIQAVMGLLGPRQAGSRRWRAGAARARSADAAAPARPCDGHHARAAAPALAP